MPSRKATTTSGSRSVRKKPKKKAGKKQQKAAKKLRPPRRPFYALSPDEQIKAVRKALVKYAGRLERDEPCRRKSDLVVVERDSAISGGLQVGYFFANALHLAATRWQHRQECDEVDLDEVCRAIRAGDADDAYDLDEIASVFLEGPIAGERCIFEGTFEELCEDDTGSEIRELWREHIGENDDDDDEDDEGDRERPVATTRDLRAPIRATERAAFAEYLRTGGL